MKDSRVKEFFVLGLLLCVGLIVLGHYISAAAYAIKGADRTIVVKGLAEREVTANIAVWPIRFRSASNDLAALYSEMDSKVSVIRQFLMDENFEEGEITISTPEITDKEVSEYYDEEARKFRYYGRATLTVYTNKVDAVVAAAQKTGELVKKGIVVVDYGPEYNYTELNRIKPSMIEAATKNARESGEKFAQDSQSRLGKIKSARQGQFSINNRDNNTPHIKSVRVVTTLEYFLSD